MGEKKTVRVILETKEIKYDVMNKTHLTGKSKEAAGADYEVVSQMQASEGDGHFYQVLRTISDAFAQVKAELSEYLSEGGTTGNNLINETVDSGGKLELEFELPSNFDEAGSASIGAMLHDYIVDRAVAEWFMITDKEDAQDYAMMATAALEKAKRSLYKRKRPERPAHI